MVDQNNQPRNPRATIGSVNDNALLALTTTYFHGLTENFVQSFVDKINTVVNKKQPSVTKVEEKPEKSKISKETTKKDVSNDKLISSGIISFRDKLLPLFKDLLKNTVPANKPIAAIKEPAIAATPAPLPSILPLQRKQKEPDVIATQEADAREAAISKLYKFDGYSTEGLVELKRELPPIIAKAISLINKSGTAAPVTTSSGSGAGALVATALASSFLPGSLPWLKEKFFGKGKKAPAVDKVTEEVEDVASKATKPEEAIAKTTEEVATTGEKAVKTTEEVASGTEKALTGSEKVLEGGAKVAEGASKFSKIATGAKAFGKVAGKVTGVVDLAMAAKEGYDIYKDPTLVQKQKEELEKQSLGSRMWTGFTNPIKSIAAGGSAAKDMYKASSEANESEREVAESRQRLADLKARKAKEKATQAPTNPLELPTKPKTTPIGPINTEGNIMSDKKLDIIASNTGDTNAAIKSLAEAIFKLSSSIGNQSSPTNIIQNNQTSKQPTAGLKTQQVDNAIRMVRNDYLRSITT